MNPTPLEIWTKAVEGIRKQGGYAYLPGEGCKLLTPSGNRCAIGHLLHRSTIIDIDLENGAGVDDFGPYEDFIEDSPIPEVLPFTLTPEIHDLMIRLQEWHDKAAITGQPLDEALADAEEFKPHG